LFVTLLSTTVSGLLAPTYAMMPPPAAAVFPETAVRTSVTGPPPLFPGAFARDPVFSVTSRSVRLRPAPMRIDANSSFSRCHDSAGNHDTLWP
jgi:hypothetical protein